MTYCEDHQFYCLACGAKGLPILRKQGQLKGKFHRKKLYCPTCKNTVNHIECRTMEEVEIFKQEFKQGVYEDEAKESLVASRATWLW